MPLVFLLSQKSSDPHLAFGPLFVFERRLTLQVCCVLVLSKGYDTSWPESQTMSGEVLLCFAVLSRGDKLETARGFSACSTH